MKGSILFVIGFVLQLATGTGTKFLDMIPEDLMETYNKFENGITDECTKETGIETAQAIAAITGETVNDNDQNFLTCYKNRMQDIKTFVDVHCGVANILKTTTKYDCVHERLTEFFQSY
ncbi:hypothetical protein RI129_009429 [Pyrocoelia pectoralis]|uniref:Uncharacterized protein n=1 Tax=Pyrocoelia pectoralis TaxID=417401 RepID=A0AAN7ZFU0_9COLE